LKDIGQSIKGLFFSIKVGRKKKHKDFGFPGWGDRKKLKTDGGRSSTEKKKS